MSNVSIVRIRTNASPDWSRTKPYLIGIVMVLLILLIMLMYYQFLPYLRSLEPVGIDVGIRDEIQIPESAVNETIKRMPKLSEVELDDHEAIALISNVVESHYQEMQRHANDDQNVHDRMIVRSHALKYRRLLQLRVANPDHTAVVETLRQQGCSHSEIRDLEIRECLEELRKVYASHERVIHALDRIAVGHTTVSLTGKPVRDAWVLTLVWQRINHPDNASKRSDLIEALRDQLADAVYPNGQNPNGHNPNMPGHDVAHDAPNDVVGPDENMAAGTYCINGRVGRILSTLTCIDADPELAKPELDVKELTNLVLMRAAKLVMDRLAEDPKRARLYATPERELDPSQLSIVKAFEEALRDEIEAIIRSDYTGILTDRDLNAIITKAQAGIGE